MSDAKAFMAAHKLMAPNSGEDGKAPRINDINSLPSDIRHVFDEMEKRLQVVMDEVSGGSPGVFVKTSCRSAKNSSTGSRALVTRYRHYLAHDTSPERDTDNNKIIALLRAGTDMMKMNTAREVLTVFASSERVFNDFDIALRHTDRFIENFAVRQWIPLDVTLEFRSFVVGDKLCAVTQYSNLIYIPALHRHITAIQTRIQSFFDTQVRKQLSANNDGMSAYTRYIVDFGITPLINDDPTSGRILIIEVNPYLPTTDSGLFCWAKDKAILEGSRPFEFRIRTEPVRGALAGLLDDWKAVINDTTPTTHVSAT